MLIYVLLLIFLLLSGLALKTKYITSRTFCIIACLAFILITGLRHNTVGADTTVYYLMFQNIRAQTLQSAVFLRGDPGFFLIFWLISRLTSSFEVMTLLVACIFYIPIGKLIYKYSEDPCLSFIILMAFNFFQFSMTGMRQTMAMGIVCWALLDILPEKKNWLRSLIKILVAVLFHRSSIIALFLLLFVYISKKEKKNFIWLSTVLIPVVFMFRNIIARFGIAMYNSDDYSISDLNSGGGYTTFFIFILLILVGYISRRKYFYLYPAADFDILMMVVAASLLSLVTVEAIFFRSAWYYSLYVIIYLPRLIQAFPIVRSQKKIPGVIVYGALLYMYLFITIGSAAVVPYRFFWQM